MLIKVIKLPFSWSGEATHQTYAVRPRAYSAASPSQKATLSSASLEASMTQCQQLLLPNLTRTLGKDAGKCDKNSVGRCYFILGKGDRDKRKSPIAQREIGERAIVITALSEMWSCLCGTKAGLNEKRAPGWRRTVLILKSNIV